MRKKNRAIPDHELADLLRQGQTLHLAMNHGGQPYVVPLTYGYEAAADSRGLGRLWVHCAVEGRKVEALEADPRVAFSIVLSQEIVREPKPCGWTCRYVSLYGEGRAELVTGAQAKASGLAAFMAHYGAPCDAAEFPESVLAQTLVIRIDIESLTGKRNPSAQGQ